MLETFSFRLYCFLNIVLHFHIHGGCSRHPDLWFLVKVKRQNMAEGSVNRKTNQEQTSKEKKQTAGYKGSQTN